MFDKQAVEEYRSLTAPDQLKNRIMNEVVSSKRSQPRLLPIIGTIAACLVLVVLSTVWRSPASAPAVVSTDGVLIASPTATASARTQADYYAVITLCSEGELEITSDADFAVRHEDGSFVPLTFPYTSSNDVTLYWYVTSSDATITVNGTEYLLHADIENGSVTIVQD